MNFGICPLSVVPVRSSASDKSEMISQLLFGEMVELLERKGSWGKIRCFWDNYVGWVDTKQLKLINQQEVTSYQSNYSCSLELFQGAMTEGHYLPITIGATLPKFDGLKFHLNGSSYTFSGQAISPKEINPSVDLLLKIARRYLYAPYLWGGRSPLGIDCSGFTQIVYKMIGTALPRDAYQQVERGTLIDFVEQALPGDLAFFENRKGRITHTGIVMPDHQIIHASGQVRIDRIDHYGIFNNEKEKYTHKLRVIKRILPETAQYVPDREPEKVVIENQPSLF
ncbi:MAG: C40 family peptidase [Bacteroidota bacterium]